MSKSEGRWRGEMERMEEKESEGRKRGG